MAVLAEALAQNHEVEILHHRPSMTCESLARFAGVDLQKVRLRIPTPAREIQARSIREHWLRYRARREEELTLSRNYDLFIAFAHWRPPLCGAHVGMLMVLFPMYNPHALGNDSECIPPLRDRLWSRLRASFNRWKMRSCLKSYRIRAANSQFTRRWAKRRWNIDCEVVFPPVEIDSPVVEKSNRILSVGRFAVSGHRKKQMEMLGTFNRLRASGHGSWDYQCVGGCGDSAEEQSFLAKVRELAAKSGASVEVNLAHARIKSLYQRAKIFWHAAGMGVDENLQPEWLEHFGMTTVEAMAAGCVPVVINKGGQPEIVEHGVSGFCWNTVEEWECYTVRLMHDDALFQKMSDAARRRAHLFSREAYLNRFQAILSPYLR